MNSLIKNQTTALLVPVRGKKRKAVAKVFLSPDSEPARRACELCAA